MTKRSSILVLFAALAPLVAGPAVASDNYDVLATVKQYDQAFNNGDMKAWNGLCTDKAVIIDDFAPHVWQGATACGDWWSALDVYMKQHGITNGAVTMGVPWHVEITGDRGYAVYPAHFVFKLKGKPVSEPGVWTLALQKLAAGWRISGWAWAQH